MNAENNESEDWEAMIATPGNRVIGFQIVNEMGDKYGADNEVLSFVALRNILNNQPDVLANIKKDKMRIVPILRNEIPYPHLIVT